MINPMLQMGAAALLPVLLSVVLFLLDKKTPFSKLPGKVKQLIYGILFGAVAIFGTEHGVQTMGVTMNVRDAAPICAGLIFGAPAGVIAGVIGGVERFLAASWGAGQYTVIACSVSTLLAGLFSAWMRKYMFENKQCDWYYGLAAGIVAEVMHMLMVFLTHPNDTRTAFKIVQTVGVPMIAFSGASVMLATLLISLMTHTKLIRKRSEVGISHIVQRRMLIVILIAFFATSAFTSLMQSGVSLALSTNLLKINVNDVAEDISNAADDDMLALAKLVAGELNTQPTTDTNALLALAEKYQLVEINVINKDGIIVGSTYDEFINYNMRSGPQSREFLCLLDGSESYVQKYQQTTYDENISRKYAAFVLEQGGFVQIAHDSQSFAEALSQTLLHATANRHVGETGFLAICDENYTIVSDPKGNLGENLQVTGLYIDQSKIKPGERFEATVYDEDSFCMYDAGEGYIVAAVLPKAEALFSRDVALYIMVFMEILIFATLFILLFFLIKRRIINKIYMVNHSLAKISAGDLDTVINVSGSREFNELSEDINATVETLRNYIDEAKARIDKELEVAKAIQSSALPARFPNRPDFSIWAGMRPAKEVGGDFYDFYMLGENLLAFLIADVSGKGIPAAMFMMTSKTMLKNLTEAGASVEEVFTHANEQLCLGNEAGMFVTAWMGILDLRTGEVSFANAGHNPPMIKRANGQTEFIKSRAGFVLAGMDGISYRRNELKLEPGDMIYLYTDGVTEATDNNNELYGENRLQAKLESTAATEPEAVCRDIKTDVDLFVGDAPQFDDITMLALKYNGKSEETK